MTAVVELAGLTKIYPGSPPTCALRACHLVIERGDYVAITGPSGSGKSTLLNLIGLLDSPTGGEYRLDGHRTATLDDNDRAAQRAHHIGFVFQSFHLVPELTATENVELGLLYQHVPRRQRHRLAVDVLTDVGLARRLDAYPAQLSGGQRQRVAIARAIVGAPSLLLCDEPTGNLDTTTTANVLDLLDTLNHAVRTIVVITHDPTVAARAQRRAVIVDGKLTPAA